MRRRALLAASGSQGNTPSIFPMYLDYDYCEEGFLGMVYCSRNPDEISLSLLDYLHSLIESGNIGEFGSNDSWKIYEKEIEQLGIEIYFKGIKVIEISKTIGNFLTTEPFNFTLESSYIIESSYGNTNVNYFLMRPRPDGGEIFIEVGI